MKIYLKYMLKIKNKKSRFRVWIYFLFNKLYNFIYFKKELKSHKKCSTSFKEEQALFFKHIKSNFFFLGGGTDGGCLFEIKLGAGKFSYLFI